MRHSFPTVLGLCLLSLTSLVEARIVYRCHDGDTVSLSTAPEPGADCQRIELDDADPRPPGLLPAPARSGTLYRRRDNGQVVLGTRAFPGAETVLRFTVPAPPGSPAHAGLGRLGRPQLDAYHDAFARAARAHRLDEAWLRAIAHAESGFDADAVSPKGALGLMQLMPATAAAYGVDDPLDPAQAVPGAARHLRELAVRFHGDRRLIAAAYNAGGAAVERYGGVPPYGETLAYVDKVLALYARYRSALAARLSG